MARVCQVTGKSSNGRQQCFAREQQKQSVASCPICNIAVFGLKAKTAGSVLRVTNAALRTIDKNGIDAVLADLRARGEI